MVLLLLVVSCSSLRTSESRLRRVWTQAFFSPLVSDHQDDCWTIARNERCLCRTLYSLDA